VDFFERFFGRLWVLSCAVSIALLHWKWGWSWWWALPLSLPGSFVVLVGVGALLGALGAVVECFRDQQARAGSSASPPDDDDSGQDEGQAEDAEPEPAPHGGVVLDDLSKKLFAQLDDPMPGQRHSALEKLRQRLADKNRTFRDLLHEFEGRHG
jgi:hypothetical protein